ncbi:MAG: heavy metal-binding domain-containing protein, partial [Ignavibacteria bacterium]|nr:heavy metal-binding domain-containing protein [Ignavibacteria bacterium]
IDSSIVRTGIIDLEMIDQNKDSKVYQDPMDWNVISDEAGKCPLCNMKLVEVSLDKAKENLVKNNFNVK